MTMTIAATIEEALVAIDGGARPIAGGTDLVVGARHGKVALPDVLVAIDRIAELRTIDEIEGSLRIGAIVSHETLMTSDLIPTGLADAAALVGSPSTRNSGTLGGNLMNASPAMDTGAPLLAMGASVELRSSTATRQLPLTDLWSGPGDTSASANELCTAVIIPAAARTAGTAYVRLEYRRAMEIAVVGAGAMVTLNNDGTIDEVAVALTAVAPTIVAVEGLTDLQGRPVDEAASIIADLASEQAAPISDLRASDTYRRHCVGVMAGRASEAAAGRASGVYIAVPVNRTLGIGAA